MVNSLRKVDFSHPTGHYTWEKIAPIEKILETPLFTGFAPKFYMHRRYDERSLVLRLQKKRELWKLLKELIWQALGEAAGPFEMFQSWHGPF